MESSNLLGAENADAKEVRQLAYRFWQKRGCPTDSPETDSPEEDWLGAVREVASGSGTRE